MGQKNDQDQRRAAEKQRPPPLTEREREAMSLGPGEGLIVPQAAFQTPILPGGPNQNTDFNAAEKSDTSSIPAGNILFPRLEPMAVKELVQLQSNTSGTASSLTLSFDYTATPQMPQMLNKQGSLSRSWT